MEQGFHYFIVISKHRMINHYLPKLLNCLDRLEEADIWSAERNSNSSNSSNSIGGIVLHLMEHVQRNADRLYEPERMYDKGIENYFPNMKLDNIQLKSRLEAVFHELKHAMETVSQGSMDMYGLYHLVEHTGYHVGQIIDRAQWLTGHQFQFVQNGIHERGLKELIEAECRRGS
ncbi:DinB family protein [Paenibacillus plantiphilus]|nr:DinB family protein [Paenibacillus plantiphilus]